LLNFVALLRQSDARDDLLVTANVTPASIAFTTSAAETDIVRDVSPSDHTAAQYEVLRIGPAGHARLNFKPHCRIVSYVTEI
jgi:hypothetical protein